ncbi:MAG: family 78 glycoside hydrolase catalytic domain [Acidimicrobiales bacterium]
MELPLWDRRTFLAHGARASATLAVGSAAADRAAGDSGRRPTPAAATSAAAPGPPRRLLVVGTQEPVGVDPDDVRFAWEVGDARRGARQTGYRIVVTTAPGRGTPSTVWDSAHVASARQAFVAYGGRTLAPDTAYRWRVATRDAGGAWSPFSEMAAFTTGLREGDWRAVWLEPSAHDPQPDRHTYVRTTAAVAGRAVARATAYVAAAHKYQLWVNGTEVDTGPSFCYPDEQYYQATDVTTHVRAGQRNAIGLLHHWYGAGQGRPVSAPVVLVQLSIEFTDGSRQVVGSDGSWRQHPAEWLPGPYRNTDGADFVENIDGRATPVGWAAASFDDGSWTAPTVLGPVGTAPFTHLYALRTRITEHRVAPASVRTLDSGAVVVDFGKIYAARPEVTFRAGVSGRTVAMHVGYLLDPDGEVSTVHGTQGTNLQFSYIQRHGAQTFRPFTFLGFRYLQIDDPGETLWPAQISALARHTTMPGVPAATLTSSLSMIDDVWDLTSRSALYTSQEQFIDTPTREKGPFLWDGANESQVAMRAFGEQNLTWQALRDFARSQKRYWPDGRLNAVYPNGDGGRDFPTFTEMYPEWVWRYYLNTGDIDTLTSLRETLENVSAYLQGNVDPVTGLITGPVLGSNGDPVYGYDLSTVADGTINVMGVNAFRRIGQALSLLGDAPAAAVHAGRSASLASAVNTRLVRTDGVYIDGLHADGSPSTHASQQVNASALAYGVVPATRVAAVGAYVAGLGLSVSPDHGLELLRALHAAGRDGHLVSLLTDTAIPGWAHIVSVGGTFTWEVWTPSDDIGDSMSHGWGSCALVALQEVVLGVMAETPPAPGGTTALDVRPPPAGIEAAGQFPTVAGPGRVSWRRPGNAVELDLGVPANAGARVHLPASTPGQVTEGGRRLADAPGVTVAAVRPGDVTVVVGAGTYRFRVTTA